MSYYAGFVRRAGAALLDGLLVSIPGLFAHQLGITTGLFWRDLALESLVWLPYYVGFHASPWQATPGKRAFGIKVTDLEGRRIRLARSAVRYFASFLSAFALLVGYLMAAFTRKRQALHDMLTGTLVVNAELEAGTVPADHEVMALNGTLTYGVLSLVFAFLAYVALTAFLLPAPEPGAGEGVAAGSSQGKPHRLRYALYELPLFGERRLVAEGTRSYGLGDVRVLPGPSGEEGSARKRLAVVDDFHVEAHIYREPFIAGFGLTLEKGWGFSWEWFDRDGDYAFSKRQGPGRIQVRMDRIDGKEEVAEILFLEDVTLRIDRLFMVPFTGGATEHLVVRKGSVLALR